MSVHAIESDKEWHQSHHNLQTGKPAALEASWSTSSIARPSIIPECIQDPEGLRQELFNSKINPYILMVSWQIMTFCCSECWCLSVSCLPNMQIIDGTLIVSNLNQFAWFVVPISFLSCTQLEGDLHSDTKSPRLLVVIMSSACIVLTVITTIRQSWLLTINRKIGFRYLWSNFLLPQWSWLISWNCLFLRVWWQTTKRGH